MPKPAQEFSARVQVPSSAVNPEARCVAPSPGYNGGHVGLTSGTKLGPYEIQSPLGACGMGEVYRATDSSLGRDVALKVLPAVAGEVQRRQC